MPAYAANLGANVAQVGLVVALQPYVGTFLQTPVGMLSDRLGRRTPLMVGTVGSLLCYLLYLPISSLGALMVVRVIHGFAMAAIYPAAAALVVDIARPEKRGEAIGFFTTGTQLGNIAGPAMGGFIVKHSGFTAAFLSSAVISGLSLLAVLSMLGHIRSSKSTVTGEKISLNWLWNSNTVGALLGTFFVMVGIASIISFLPLHGRQIGIDIDRVGLMISTVYLGSAFLRVLAGRASDRIGRSPVILLGLITCAGATFLISITNREILLHIATLLYGVGMGSTLPATAALVADVAPVQMMGFAMGLNSSLFNAGLAIGATGLGIVAASSGFARMYLVTAVTISAAVILILVLTRQKRQAI
jgi:MFS family permease